MVITISQSPHKTNSYRRWNQVLAHRNPLEDAPHHACNDSKVQENVDGADFGA
jgi:hypothetical protein